MAKVKTHEIDSRVKYKITGDFYNIISSLRTKKEIINFFIGLLTPSESLMMARRIQIACLLIEGKSHEEIRKQLKVGFTTISKTDRWLNGNDDEYNVWIKNLLKTTMQENKPVSKKPHFSSALDKYSHHRFTKKILNN